MSSDLSMRELGKHQLICLAAALPEGAVINEIRVQETIVVKIRLGKETEFRDLHYTYDYQLVKVNGA